MKILKKIKDFFLFAKASEGLDKKQKVFYWLWNAFALIVASVCMGVLCLSFAIGLGGWPMLKSYLANSWIVFLNIAPIVLLALLLWAVTRRSYLAFLITAVPTMVLAIANYLKLRYRNDPLMFEDILVIREAVKMSGQYSSGLDKRIVIAIVLIIVASVALFFIARGKPKSWSRAGIAAAVVLAVVFIRPLYVSNEVYNEKTANTELINIWSATDNYVSRGNVYPFIYSINSAFDKKPEGYSENEIEELLGTYSDADIPEDKKVSIMSFMLEAYCDITQFDEIELKDDPYEALHKLQSESYSGTLISDVFSGGTSVTEREFLTGMTNFGSLRKKSNSYIWYLRSQGYTVEGCHPSYDWFYNRRNINTNLGFENYYFVENYFSPLTNGGYGMDDVFFAAVQELYEKNLENGKPYFSYNISYQGHGPYNDTIVYKGGDHIANETISDASRNILNNYLDGIQDTNERLLNLVDYLRDSSDPVVLLVFGDHKPWLGDANSVYNELGINIDISTDEGFMNYYSTPYFIWANDAAKQVLGCDFSGEGPTIGAYFLMNELFKLCSWDGPAFMQYTNSVVENVQVMNSSGIYVENGEISRQLSEKSQRVFETYSEMQYYMRRKFIS